jgi:hypothetical protein
MRKNGGVEEELERKEGRGRVRKKGGGGEKEWRVE